MIAAKQLLTGAWLLGGAAGVYGVYRLVEWSLEQLALRDPAKCPDALRDCPPVTGKTPNPDGGTPIAGRASALDYPWCHRVEKGQTAESIALEITGDAGRAREIFAANTHRKTAVDAAGKLDFSPALCAGERLHVPFSMNPWIDQTGAARRQKEPFPGTLGAATSAIPSLLGSGVSGLRGFLPFTRNAARGVGRLAARG